MVLLLSLCLSSRPSIPPSLSIYLSICPSICPSFHPHTTCQWPFLHDKFLLVLLLLLHFYSVHVWYWEEPGTKKKKKKKIEGFIRNGVNKCPWFECFIDSLGSCSRARLLQPVKKRTRHILCKLCCPDG